MQIAKALYIDLGPQDLSVSLSVLINFDEQQRVSRFENLTVNGVPKMPSFEVTEEINKITAQIKTFPKDYLVKQLEIDIQPGGEIKTDAVYFSDN